MDLNKRIKTLSKDFVASHSEYLEALKELNAHEGKLVSDIGLEKVNAILANIQNKFRDIHPVLIFIQTYYQFSLKELNTYNNFIDTMKKQGAKEEPTK